MQLEIEREALRRETDAASRDRLEKLENELADLRADQAELRKQWESEKGSINQVREIKEQIEQTKLCLLYTSLPGLTSPSPCGATAR